MKYLCRDFVSTENKTVEKSPKPFQNIEEGENITESIGSAQIMLRVRLN